MSSYSLYYEIVFRMNIEYMKDQVSALREARLGGAVGPRLRPGGAAVFRCSGAGLGLVHLGKFPRSSQTPDWLAAAKVKGRMTNMRKVITQQGKAGTQLSWGPYVVACAADPCSSLHVQVITTITKVTALSWLFRFVADAIAG